MYAAGKTHLVGDMLRTEREHGPVLYVNIAGEDGYLTISRMGLGEVGVTVETYDDLMTLIQEAAKTPYRAIGVDSLHALAQLAKDKVTGGNREPLIPSGDQLRRGAKNEWPDVHRNMLNAVRGLRRLGDRILVTCAIDKAADPLDLSGSMRLTRIAPDLPGKEATMATGWFDFVGVLSVQAHTPTDAYRVLDFRPDGVVQVRQRLPRPITDVIKIPTGGGAWAAILRTLEAHLG
jgi:hypothetical protein